MRRLEDDSPTEAPEPVDPRSVKQVVYGRTGDTEFMFDPATQERGGRRPAPAGRDSAAESGDAA